ncbi:MAG: class I SAM-dependent methyltransferase [Bacteroidetes bacterium]|nr:class I SAM-dependent methyltransferase [Bacteroidota bacterium]
MMKEFWESRYSEKDYAYGKEPNEFFKKEISKIKAGKLLLPAEGEGRNAVFAASLGWDVLAVDQSYSGKEKADSLSKEQCVKIEYLVADLNEYIPDEKNFDAVALIFAHFPIQLRAQIHSKLANALKPGGILILEAFSKEHIRFNEKNPGVGGPKDESMLYSIEEMRNDFKNLNIEHLVIETATINEGIYHCGDCSVLRMIARRL